MEKNLRKESIYKEIKDKNFKTFESLASEFNVSEMTVRRDILELEKNGLVIRAKKGAYFRQALDIEMDIREKKVKNINNKNKIAKEALKFIKDESTIFLDSGSTCYEFAKELKVSDFNHLNVITSDLSIIILLKDSLKINLIVLGGNFSNKTDSMNGVLTNLCVKSLYADVAIIGAAGISKDLKLYTPSENKILQKKDMVRNSQKAILLADSSKFYENKMYYIVSLKDFDLVITDSEIGEKEEDRLKKDEIKYIKVG